MWGFQASRGVVERLGSGGAARGVAGSVTGADAHRYGHTATADALIARGADLAATDIDGWTPLHHAARYGDSATADALIARGAPLNAKDKSGLTPLNHATRYGYTATTARLQNPQTPSLITNIRTALQRLQRG